MDRCPQRAAGGTTDAVLKKFPRTLYDRKKLNILLRVVTTPHSLNPPPSGFFVVIDSRWHSSVNLG